MDWLSVADIARTTRIPAPTARRYASLFREFLPHRKSGRTTRYAPDCVPIFERISALYHEGRVSAEIEDILRADYQRTIDVDPGQAQPPAQVLPPDVARTVQEMMEQFGASLKVIADQKAIIDSLRSDVRKLKTGFVLLARSQKRLKALPEAGGRDLQERLDARAESLSRKDAEIEELALGLSFDTSDLKIKMQILEQELVRLRQDRRELEQHLLDKIGRKAG